MKWTPEQQKAIDEKSGGGNILVSAAAGSGKTAVLVERVIEKILRNETSVDRLLVVTFTEAAASEMREKIINRIVKEMEKQGKTDDEKRFLKEQVNLAETADIMTIDAFCNRVVRNNFNVLGIDANTGIADEATIKMLSAEALENVFDMLYTTQNVEYQMRFERLLQAYASNRSDAGLEKLIQDTYDFITSFADPKQWLDEAVDVYKKPVLEMPHAEHMMAVTKKAAERCLADAEKYILEYKAKLNDKDETDYIIYERLLEYAEALKETSSEILASDDWDTVYSIYKTHFKTKKKKNFASVIEMDIQKFVDDRQDITADIGNTRNSFIAGLKRGVIYDKSEMEKMCPSDDLHEQASDIVWIVKLFIEEFDRIKDSRAVKEFSDIEHLAYELFRDNEDIRNTYRDKYDEILIDEYQDTNGLQDSIFSLISRNNIFMVGDLKQSIYRFRGGDPYIFKEKSELYETNKTNDKKIVLAQNFRSRLEILDSVNSVFECIMTDETGDVDYTGKELIVRDKERDYYPKPKNDCHAELHYIAVTKDEGLDKNEEEIKFVADKINQLLNSGVSVYDKETGGYRPLKKKDIVILENSVKGNGEAIVSELSKYGIDAFAENKSFFGRREIKVMVSLISVINNVHQDIPLLSVMRSPIGGFSDDELARIRINGMNCRDFIGAVKYFCINGGKKLKSGVYRSNSPLNLKIKPKKTYMQLRRKCRDFISSLNRWRGYVRSKSVAQLIWSVYEESYFYDIMGAIEYGEEAQFNLRLLYERAKMYESAGFKGLFNFIKYIDLIEGREEDLGGAKLIGENHDVVRVMTIHKSKGLEFPYVFVIGAGKRMSGRQESPMVQMHKDLKFGMPHIHYKSHYMRDTKIKDYIKEVNKREQTAERMRVLYVALTRAREKLYVVVSNKLKDNQSEETLKEDWRKCVVNGKMIEEAALKAGTYGDWLCPAAYDNQDKWHIEFHGEFIGKEDVVEEEEEEIILHDDELKKSVYEIMDYNYPYTMSNTIPSRTSVTKLKELSLERDEYEYEPKSRQDTGDDDILSTVISSLHVKPDFMREKGEKPANEIGTLYHLVMSEIDFDTVRYIGSECAQSELERLVNENKISDDDMKYIDSDKIKAFFESDIGKRMIQSEKVYREMPFQINIPATEYDPSLDKLYETENVLLQGIIDCYFEEDGELVLVDYKTDRIGMGGANEIRSKYNKQLELYKKAIEKLTGKTVKESMLYLFANGETI